MYKISFSPILHPNGSILRLSRPEDAEAYYRENFDPLDPELVYFTGSKPHFSREEVVDFFLKCTADPNRYDFLILDKEGHIIGESILNEIDWSAKSANFRIALFHPRHRNLGIGTWAMENTLKFGFHRVGLHRITLTVFPFNRRGIHIYEKAGFRPIQLLTDPDEIEMELTSI